MPRRAKGITACELLARLAQDEAYQAMIAAQDAELAEREKEDRATERPLLDDLASAGFEVDWTGELLERPDRAAAIPILLDHVRRPYPDRLREWMARALGTPFARPYWSTLVDRYRRETGRQTKDGLAAALADVARDDAHVADLIALVDEPDNGPSRILLLSALADHPSGIDALRRHEHDPELRQEVRSLLRRLAARRPTADDAVRPPEGWDDVSTALDVPDLGRFRRCLGGPLGLGGKDVRRPISKVHGLREEEAIGVGLPGNIDGERAELHVVVEMDDPDAIDVHLFTPPHLADRVTAAVEQCVDDLEAERGLRVARRVR